MEDPVGSEVRTTREPIKKFSSAIDGLEQARALLTVRIAGNEAAFCFELETKAGDQTFVLSPIDVMTFDDAGKITSMRAFWSAEDMSVASDGAKRSRSERLRLRSAASSRASRPEPTRLETRVI